ncbi:hypothetical protein DPEC_G00312800 [Dallia pectoralis]|uniref:Uncharacterized protein n=1 Tax=Dallia pectoralis TaxID=75939 RepID=A0ACC2FBT1_DALPE|nr:hypothetical protein DPEC_G00312800 [Dallia pectoralis]
MKLLCVLLVLLTANFCGGVTIQQTPVLLVCWEGDDLVTLHCHHDDSSHYYMFWYRQKGTKMEMLTFSLNRNNADTEVPFEKNKYTMNRTELTDSSLEIKNLVVGDSAVYYCASSIAH